MKLQLQIFSGLFLFLLLFLLPVYVFAQCSFVVNAFPYNEDFETSNGGWKPGGVSADWVWGKPSKPVINKAYSGQQCWVTGGLTGSGYADNESSWVESPCFDFSSLQNPYISFEVFWETELKYDGAAMQYSTNGGSNWQNLFDANTQSDCYNSSWYNYGSVVFLSSLGANDGWSGNVQPNSEGNCQTGNGSGQWITKQHTLAFLAGKQNVKFRFVFASGNICNDYDGFAFDHIYIGEAPTLTADFNYTCRGNKVAEFENSSQNCATSFLWNFGDAASGASNTSTDENTSHTFSSAGTYTVTFTASGNGLNASKISKQVTVLDAGVELLSPLKCSGDNNASAVINVSGGDGNYSYAWATNPVQNNDTVKNLSAGTYSVQIDDEKTCSITQQISISEPAKLQAGIQTKDAVCTSNNGEASISVSGGVAPYTYKWNNISSNNSVATNLAPGNYSVDVTDANACKLSATNIIVENINPLKISLGNDTTICPGNSFELSPGNFVSYLWQDNSITPSYSVIKGNTYWVKVSDSLGCIASDTIKVVEDCGDIFFPSAFTPNQDGNNDYFGPLGNLSAISNYHLIIYNRWGQLVFQSTDPYKKWNGNFQKNEATVNMFVWMATFTYHGKSISKKGTLMAIR